MTASLDALRAQFAARYAIERELGRGGMGAVYLARDVRLDRPVALKVLPPEFAADSGLRERFLRETRMAASFSHPNIVPVYSVEDDATTLAFAMGFVDGESLGDRVKRMGPLPVRDAVRIMQDVCYALAYAHGRGVVHRDLKPDNIMLEKATGRALLMDFGIARAISAPTGGTQALTRVGEVVGTPQYMSPEQATGDAVDGRADLYSLGLVAFYALTGQVLMDGASTQQILVRQLTETPPSLCSIRSDVPVALDDAIARCLAKEASDRFPDASALLDTIDAAQMAPPEVPVPIRLFTQELAKAGLVTFFVTLVLTQMVPNLMARGLSTWDAIIPAVVLGSIIVTRWLGTRTEARGLLRQGFTPSDILAGMDASVRERQDVRAARASDPAAQLARRTTVRRAVVALLVAMAALAYFWTHRIPNGDGTIRLTLAGMIAAYSGVILLGTSLFVLLNSPFRAPPPERLFRLVWLGMPGRLFLAWAARGESQAAGGVSAVTLQGLAARSVKTPRTSATPAASHGRLAAPPTTPVPAARVTELETRVAKLEAWQRASLNGDSTTS